jgi:probable HAF family extracellular repeat protein
MLIISARLSAQISRINLPTLGGPSTYASDINGLGQVVGGSQTASGEWHAFLLANGTMRDLGILGGTGIDNASGAVAINKFGQVAGTSSTISDIDHAFLWQDGVMTDLGTLGETSAAADINNRGQVVGTSQVAPAGLLEPRAFLWQDGVIYDLLGVHSEARAINNRGQVVGRWAPSRGSSVPFIWQDGVVTEIGGFAGSGTAEDINDSGQIALTGSITPNSPTRAFLWESGMLTDLGTLGGPYSVARAINTRGQIVGLSWTMSGEAHGFEWHDGVMTDISPCIPTAITDNGQIPCGAYIRVPRKSPARTHRRLRPPETPGFPPGAPTV